METTLFQSIWPELSEWLLLLGRWLHILVGITWIGTSIFFMWLDRTLEPNPQTKREGHLGELWMVHGGGFYHVEKLQMGPTPVPPLLHWFKWESYWTWLSGVFLLVLIFYTGNGTYLLDPSVSSISYGQGLLLAVGSIVVSWFFYDFLWESQWVQRNTRAGHILTALWFGGMAYLLCHTLSGRAAYIHMGAMMGTWMTANVFLRIIPRQVLMVEASKNGSAVDPQWSANAKNRSTHNTYLTLPVIFVMLSNHFPSTYGHRWNWLILLLVSIAGALIREYFISRVRHPQRAIRFGLSGALVLLGVMIGFREDRGVLTQAPEADSLAAPVAASQTAAVPGQAIQGKILWTGKRPEPESLSLPLPCMQDRKSIVNNELEVGANLGIRNVLVVVQQPPQDGQVYRFPQTSSLPPVVLDQKYCLYEPRVIAVQVNQPVDIVNSDPIFHNVKSTSKNNEEFNLAMPGQNDRIRRTFLKKEISVQTKCSVHPWMTGYIAVLDHPYFVVTDAEGRFSIPGLAPGKWKLDLWHERLGSKTIEVQVPLTEAVMDWNFETFQLRSSP